MIYSTISGGVALVHHRVTAIIAVTITIILKYCLARYVYQKGKRSSNNIFIAGSKENMSDVLSAISIFIAIILSFLKRKH